MPNITTNHAITYTNLSHEPLFLCWDHSVAGMKTVELPPPPFPVPIFTPPPPPSYPF